MSGSQSHRMRIVSGALREANAQVLIELSALVRGRSAAAWVVAADRQI